MNKNIYEWLLTTNNSNNNNTSNVIKETPTSITPPSYNSNGNTLIECILIISTNGILIDRQSLLHYCDSVVNSINNNNENSTPYYGLSKQQFQILYNSINKINIDDPSLATTSALPNSNDSNKIKFNSSITIINENNKCILKQQKQQQYNNNTTINPIVSYNNNNNGKIGYQDISRSSILFFLVWRNKVIRNEILFHTRLYNIHLNRVMYIQLKRLPTYKYRGYLDKLEIIVYDDDSDEELEELGELEEEDKKEEKEEDKKKCNTFEPNLIPYGVSSLLFDLSSTILKVNSIPDSVTSVRFTYFIDQIFSKGIFPDSITSLIFDKGIPYQSISLEWLPKSLKSLSFNTHLFQQTIKLNELPKSLTQFNLLKEYEGKIEVTDLYSIPTSIKSLNYTFNSNDNNNTLSYHSIPVSTTFLEFDDSFNQILKPGDIPHNVASMKLSFRFNSEIRMGSLPVSLKSLEFGTLFNRSINANVLPSNLTFINMISFNQPLIPNLFPQSITSIRFTRFNQEIPIGYFYNYTNLKSLKFNIFNQDIPLKTLPQSLTSLDLGYGFNQPIDLNVFPTSLSTLKMRYIYFKLPSSITSLSIYSCSTLEPGTLPCNLKELYLENYSHDQQLSMESFDKGILPQSLQSIYIDRNNTKYINSLDPLFFKNYIKFIKSLF